MAGDVCAGEGFAVVAGVELTLNRRTILDYVDLTVREGELVALVGPNGAGKTSLLRCLAGMEPFHESRISC